MFEQNELKSLQTLLNRVDLKGNEALSVALLLQKIGGLITSDEPKAEDKKENKTK